MENYEMTHVIKVTYEDGKDGGLYTFEEVRNRFAQKGEVEAWIDGFIGIIIMRGYAYTRMGTKYEMVKV